MDSTSAQRLVFKECCENFLKVQYVENKALIDALHIMAKILFATLRSKLPNINGGPWGQSSAFNDYSVITGTRVVCISSALLGV
jgi:hypothetical protein